MITEVRERIAQSLHNAVWLTLGMERQDYRIERPFSANLMQASRPAVALSPETRIAEVFNSSDVARQLLILGEPGSGKTTMMLELAKDLLERAIEDKAEPIPVLVNLSSWKDPKQPIFDWLVGELKVKYGIRKDLAQQWIQESQLLPLLDGLDEVAPQHQRACATALNTWLIGDSDQRPCGVLICCRREEFEQVVQKPLSLYGAVYLQALTSEQIEDYFAQFGLQDVWQTVQQDEALQELLTKPLFLSMFGLVQTQRTFSLRDWQLHTTFADQIEYLLDTYWEAVMTRELINDPGERQRGIRSKTYGKKPLPDRKSIRRSLIFAAKMLERESSTELLIEKLQPAVLITWWQKWTYRLIFGLFSGLITFQLLELAFKQVDKRIDHPTWWLFTVLVGVLWLSRSAIQPVEIISISIPRLAKREALESIWLTVVVALLLGLTYGLIGGLMLVLILGIITVLTSRKADIQTCIKPNQGIKNSIENMIIVSTIVLVLTLLLKSLLVNVIEPQLLPGIISDSLFISIGVGALYGGGIALVQHLTLRFVLVWNRYAPLRYDLLLNYCTERLLLQRVGGRYRFMHKTLQDYFAKMDLPN